MKASSQLALTAVHEAGHAVVGWVVGIRVDGVSLDPEPNTCTECAKFGETTHARDCQWHFWNHNREEAWRRRFHEAGIKWSGAERLLMAYLAAGHAAQFLVDPDNQRNGCDQDIEEAMSLVGPDRLRSAWSVAVRDACDVIRVNNVEWVRLWKRLGTPFPPNSIICHVGVRELRDILRPCTFTRTVRAFTAPSGNQEPRREHPCDRDGGAEDNGQD